MEGLFAVNDNMTTLEYLKDWDVTNVTNFNYTFGTVENLTDASAINDWNINPNASFDSFFNKTPAHPEFTKVQGTWNNGTFVPNP